MIEEAYQAGMMEFGENKPQEMRDKAKMLEALSKGGAHCAKGQCPEKTEVCHGKD